jgi:hypothetical protein
MSRKTLLAAGAAVAICAVSVATFRAQPGEERPQPAIEQPTAAVQSIEQPTAAVASEPTDSNATPSAPVVPASVAYRNVVVPAGTVLPLMLDTSVASDQNRVEDAVRAHLRRSVVVNGVTVIPAGSTVSGYVTSVAPAGRVKGRGRIAFRFQRLNVASHGTVNISTSSVARQAPATKRDDAAKIGIPAAGGAIIGAIAGGKKGAAIGAAAGGGAGTAVVLTTKGKEARLGRGAAVGVTLQQPITVRVPVR